MDGIDIEFPSRELLKPETEAQPLANSKKTDQADEPTLKVGKSYPKIYKYVIYLVPTFSNPSGKTLSLQMRKDLVILARKYDAVIVSDDVYDFLSWPHDPHSQDCAVTAVPPRLVDVDRSIPGYSTWGNTASNGSFSKVIGPDRFLKLWWCAITPYIEFR
ncbi:hypothetical protein LZ31DRAFT_597909 [Colletotrichum somersetense]|nr:hypothetical protein LZ31DRAFT_597909 [Colletotrichum somersetense]